MSAALLTKGFEVEMYTGRPDGTVVASQLSYKDWYRDPRLIALIATALENNRDLMAATARIEQARWPRAPARPDRTGS